MQRLSRLLTSVAATVAVIGSGAFGASAAFGYSPAPSTVYSAADAGSCNKSPCILYPKSAQLPSGRIVAAFEDSEGPVVGQKLPIYKSDDDGDTWQKLTDIPAPAAVSSDARYAGLTSNWTNPYLYVLPSDLGGYAKGTLMLADVVSSGTASSNDRLYSAIVLWASTDQGATWTLASKVVASPTSYTGLNGDTVWQDPVWEPYLMMHGGKLVVYYSDERDFTGYDPATGVARLDPDDATAADSGGQILAHTTWDGTGAWTAHVVDVSGTTVDRGNGKTEIGGGRPGMTNIVPTSDGKWMLTYEYWGGGDNVRYKIADDPEKFFASGGAEGTNISSLPVASGSHALAQGGSPVLISRPDGALVYNAAGSGSVWVNESGRSDGTWKEYQTSIGGGYSRNLQYDARTGRVQILQTPWGTTTVSAAQLDLGHSAGTYYSIVNKATGELLSTVQDKTQDASLTGDQPDIITWANNPANDTQRWHAVKKGADVTFLNKAGGRSIAIWLGASNAGARAAQWVDDGASDKLWTLVASDDGSVRIRSAKNTSLYLTGHGSGGVVDLRTALAASDDDAQEWQLVAESSTPVTVTPAVTSDAPSQGGWYSGPARVALTPSNPDATVQYRLHGTDDWTTVSGPIEIAQDGVTVVDYRALDAGAPVEGSDGSVTVKVDTTAPVTSAAVSPASGTVSSGSTITATFTATDATSGVQRTEYSTDGGTTWTAATDSGASFTAVGSHVVQYRSVDTAGNREATKSVTLTVAEPQTTAKATITSSDAPSADGWYQQSVIVALGAPDTSTKIQYRTNGGAWRSYSKSITVSANGLTTLDHRLLKAGDVVSGSTAQTLVKIDKTLPVAAAVRDPGSTGTPRNSVAVTFSARDTYSGVAGLEYRVNSGSWTAAGAAPLVLDRVGDFVVSYRATDQAGNVSTAKAVTVTISADPTTSVRSSASSVKAGGVLTLTLKGFVRWDSVELTLGGTSLGSVLTDESGSAKVSVRVPATAPAGPSTVTATGSTGKETASTTVAVKR